jgi:hypothetical protein
MKTMRFTAGTPADASGNGATVLPISHSPLRTWPHHPHHSFARPLDSRSRRISSTTHLSDVVNPGTDVLLDIKALQQAQSVVKL